MVLAQKRSGLDIRGPTLSRLGAGDEPSPSDCSVVRVDFTFDSVAMTTLTEELSRMAVTKISPIFPLRDVAYS